VSDEPVRERLSAAEELPRLKAQQQAAQIV